MGDEAREGAASSPQPDSAPHAPLAKKRRGKEEDLRRVAEIVMVLSAMVEMRAGKEPTVAERALVAEARERLAWACEEVRPKDLFSSEAVRVMVEDLGLNRSKDPVASGPPKMSIAERVQHTKKKMEEPQDHASSSHASQPHYMCFGPTPESHESQRLIAGKSSPMVSTTGGFPNNSSGVHIPALASSMSSNKPTLVNDAHSALLKSSYGKDSSSIPTSSIEVSNQRLDARINGPSYFTLVRPAAVANYLPEKASVSGTSISATLATLSPATAQANHEVKVLQTSHHIMKTLDTKVPVVQATQMNTAMGIQSSQGLTFVPVTSFISNHNEIAKSVMSIMQSKIPNCPNISLPSTEYMTRPLNCQVCKMIITDVESLLVCDACENGIHLKCLQSHGAKAIPKADWICQKCLSTSNGKPFPPKYGRVTRHIPVVKASSSGGGTILLEKNWENTEAKSNHQKLMENENLSSFTATQAPKLDSSLRESARESKVSMSKEIEDTNFNWKKQGEGMYSGTSVDHMEEKSRLLSSTPAAQLAFTGSHDARIRLSEAERVDPCAYSQSPSSDKQPQQGCLSTSVMQTSVSESMPLIKAQSESLCSSPKQGAIVEILCQSHLCSDLQVSQEANVHMTTESADNLSQKSSILINDDLKKTSISSEVSRSEVLEVRPECEHESQMIDDQMLENWSNVAEGNSSLEGLHRVDWVGDILEVLDGRTYYKSCCINGYIIKLHDNVIVSTDNYKFYPAKLLSLWEDNIVLSKLALVNEYCFPSCLPDGVMPPSTPVKDEVYASDIRNTILASSVCGLCNVLAEDKFREETGRRTLVADKADCLHSVFMCKWMFDGTNGIFQSPAQLL